MELIRNMKKNQVIRLADQIPIKKGSVISRNLARQQGFECTLYSFAPGEGISEQVSFGDVLCLVIGGQAILGTPAQTSTIYSKADVGAAFLAARGLPYSIETEAGLQLLYLQIFQRKGEESMFIKNFVQNQVVDLAEQIAWESGQIVSTTLVQRDDLTLTLFAFDAGEGVSTHAAGGDAMVVALAGTAEIIVDGIRHRVSQGESIIMPANIPHSVKAETPYKMLLIVVKPERMPA